MLKTIVAYTYEIDDVDAAVSEILEQLDIQSNLKKNSVGIVACHCEFVFSGVFKAVCDALPFDVSGTITSAQAVENDLGTLMFTIMVITSETDEFCTKITAKFEDNPYGEVEKCYDEAAGLRPNKKPGLAFMFGPFIPENSGDGYMKALSQKAGDVPIFGTLAIGETEDFSNCFMLYNGESYDDSIALVLIYADISPVFFIANISESKILGKSALITKSNGNVLNELNGRPASEYFKELGLAEVTGATYAMSSLPFMLDYDDGTDPVAKVLVGFTPDGDIICAGDMPEGTNVRVGVFDKADVLFTTGNALKDMAKEFEGRSGMLAYSCISRSMTLGGEMFAELELVTKELNGEIPFMIAYSGGEVCPTNTKEKRNTNRFHNNAFIACIF